MKQTTNKGCESKTGSSIAAVPPMGWNSWNFFSMKVTEDQIKKTANAMIDSGMFKAGYKYLVIDDSWQSKERDQRGNLKPDPIRFPGGMKALSDYIHDKGLKFGIYSSPGPLTCAQFPGSYEHEEQDVELFLSWNMDFLKYDACSAQVLFSEEKVKKLYAKMGDLLKKSGREVVFSISIPGKYEPWLWAHGAGAHMWRTTLDLVDTWDGKEKMEYGANFKNSIDHIGFSQNGLEKYAGPGHWNDPDMLVVGLYSKGAVPGKGCADVEYRSHFSLWCLLAAPLMASCDPGNMNEATRNILMNHEAIAIDQDPLGRQGYRIYQDDAVEVWRKDLVNNNLAIGFFNRSEKQVSFSRAWKDLDIKAEFEICDVWKHESMGESAGSINLDIPSHGCVLLRLIPKETNAR